MKRVVHIAPNSETGRRMTTAKYGNQHHAPASHQGKREIERRKRQLERSSAKRITEAA